MARRTIVAGVALAGGLAGAALVLAFANARWRRDSEQAFARLDAAARAAGDVTIETLFELPAPVVRYYRFALPDSAPPIRRTTIEWTGEFRMRPDADWVPFTATQHFSSRPPGFVWDARIEMMPLVPVRVRDAYASESASMEGRLAGLVPVVDQGGTPEIAQSALARWLGEAVWFPTALLPGDGVEWQEIDDHTARVTVTDGDVSASAEFVVAASGEVIRMRALRYRDVDGVPVLTPFEGRYGAYVERDGFMIPGEAEVAWLLEEGEFAYWRGRPTGVRYE